MKKTHSKNYLPNRLLAAQQHLFNNDLFASRSELLMAESLLTGLAMLPGPAAKKKLLAHAQDSLRECIEVFNKNLKPPQNRSFEAISLKSPKSRDIIAKALGACLVSLDNTVVIKKLTCL